jgi:hypothetical protein
MTRLRPTTRGLMVAVAIVAFATGLGVQGWNLMARTRARRMRVEYHWRRAVAWASVADRLSLRGEAGWLGIYKEGPLASIAFLWAEWDDLPEPGCGRQEIESERKRAVDFCRARASYHEARIRAWDRAARNSWSADPIEPPRPTIKWSRLRLKVDS